MSGGWEKIHAIRARAERAERKALAAARSYRRGWVNPEVWGKYEQARLEANRARAAIDRAKWMSQSSDGHGSYFYHVDFVSAMATDDRYVDWWADDATKRLLEIAAKATQDAEYLANSAEFIANRRRWIEYPERPGWTEHTLRILSCAASLFPLPSRARWVEEWRGELATLVGRRRFHYILHTLCGIPSMTLSLRVSALRNR